MAIGLAGLVTAVAIALLALPSAAGAAGGRVAWLCKPGKEHNPCMRGQKTTLISPTGERLGVKHPRGPRHRKVDCFYVYPTVSDQQRPNANLHIDPEERSIALYQAARYGLHCRVYAPMYRQLTLQAIGGTSLPPDAQLIAYDDVLSAWKTYLRKYNQGRGVVLIGHSQGTFVLRELIHQVVDPKKNVRKRLISAILLGGNVTLASGRDIGGDFHHIPACRRARQFGCVIAFSTFNSPVPDNTKFGRPSTLAEPGLPTTGDVLCNNPAALGGGSAPLTTVFPTQPFAPGTTIGLATGLVGMPQPPNATTPWFEVQGYTGACSADNNAHVLQISPIDGAPTLHPVPDQTWGLHLVDANIALGNLTDDTAVEAKAWLRANTKPKKKR
jgi:hypothetical protein